MSERPVMLFGLKDVVLANPAGERAHWPRACVESRLRFEESREVSELVSEWLAQDSDDPWALATEKIQIGLAIRDLATMDWRSGRTYTISDPARTQAKIDAPPIIGLMQSCQNERPHIWETLDDAIAQGIEKRTLSGDNARSADPWTAEAEVDRRRFAQPASVLSSRGGIALAAGIAAVDGLVAWISDQIIAAAIFAGFVVLLIALAEIPWPPLRKVLAGIGQKAGAGYKMPAPPTTTTFGDRISAWALVAAIGVLVLEIVHASLGWTFWLLAAVGAVAGGAWLLRRISGVLISERVMQAPTVMPSPPRPAQPAISETQTVDRASAPAPEALEYQLMSPDQVPPPSPAATELLRLADERPRRARRIYLEALAQLVVCYLLVVSVAAAAHSTGAFPSGELIAVWIAAALFLALTVRVARWTRSMGWMDRAGFFIRYILWSTSKDESREPLQNILAARDEAAQHPAKLRPTFLSVGSAAWLVITLATAPFYAGTALAVTLLLFASAIAYLVVLRWRLDSVERDYPLSAPFRLLALRVFGSPSLEDFIALTSKWRGVGTIQRLDGHDTAGDRPGDVFAMLRGRLDIQIVESGAELEHALTHFAEKPDSRLQYRLNSIQCTDATWQAALDRLLGSADVIVMDLSGFTQQRLGCKYELGKLIDAQALNRVLLLTDESTDHALLETVLKQAWRAACEKSANQPLPHRVTVIQTGGVSGRGSQESEYQWKTRLARRLRGDRLVALMVDKALANQAMREAIPPVRWARLSDRRWPRRVAMAGLVLIAGTSAVVSFHSYQSRPSGADAAGIAMPDGRR